MEAKKKFVAEGHPCTFGCDPEIFLKDKNTNKIIGSEKIIPKDGIPMYESAPNSKCKIVRDGIQVEIQHDSNTCRQSTSGYVRDGIQALDRFLKKNHPEVKICFSEVVKVSKKEMDSLSPESKEFGCKPSFNYYLRGGISPITVNPGIYRYRSAGGHVHLGYNEQSTIKPDRIIPVMDVLLGNTCVMLDRNPLNVERRKVYGRAGEYRVPKYGIEYRTLSNFWIKYPQLHSMVFGLARMSLLICKYDLDKELLSLINQEDIQLAINNNDAILAKQNFNKIKPFIQEHISTTKEIGHNKGMIEYSCPFYKENIDAVEHFLNKGMKYWFRNNPTENTKLPTYGFENFIAQVVRDDMNGKKKVETYYETPIIQKKLEIN
jgi:hypothetical protein